MQQKTVTLDLVIRHLQENPYLLTHQRFSYTPERIMMLLEHHKLDLLKVEFQAHGQKGIALKSFLWLMLNSIDHKEDDRWELIYCLTRLFRQIDIDGDEHLVWAQFITYIIEAVKESKSEQPVIATSEQQILKNVNVGEARTYRPSQQIKDVTADRGSPIKLLVYIEKMNIILCLDEQRNFIRLYDSETLKEQAENRIYVGQALQQQHIVSYAYGDDALLVIGSSKDAHFYTPDKMKFKMTPATVVLLSQPVACWYLPLHKLFMVADCQFHLREIRKPPRRQNEKQKNTELISFKAHDRQITCIGQLESPKCLITSSMDGNLRLWDMTLKKRMILELRDPLAQTNMNGVMGFDVGYGNTILSWNFTNHLSVWTPEYSLVRPFAGHLKSSGMIMAARCMPGSTIAVSIDNRDTVRVWDFRKLTCVQSVIQPGNHNIMVIGSGFLIYGRKMTLFQQAKDSGAQQESRRLMSIPKDIFFNFFYGVLVILTPTQLRVHNAKNGQLMSIHTVDTEGRHDVFLTSFCRATQRKLYLGNSQNCINLVNIMSGAILKPVKQNREDSSVNKLFYFQDEQLLVSASSRIESYDEQLLEEGAVKALQLVHQSDITQLTFCQQLLIFITISTSHINVWSFETFKLLYSQSIDGSVRSVKFIPNYYGFLVLTDEKILVFSIESRLLEYKLECSFEGLLDNKETNLTTILCFQFKKQSENAVKLNIPQANDFDKQVLDAMNNPKSSNSILLIVGDSQGYVMKIDIGPVIESLNLRQILIRKKIKYFQFKRRQNALTKVEPLYEPFKEPQKQFTISRQIAWIEKAHRQQIANIVHVPQLNCFCSCSDDHSIKMYDVHTGNKMGHMRLDKLAVLQWQFPSILWINQRLRQFDQVMHLAKQLDLAMVVKTKKARKILPNEEETKTRFMMNLYMSKDQQQKFIDSLQGKVEQAPPPKKQRVTRFPEEKQEIRRQITELENSMKVRFKSSSLNRQTQPQQIVKIDEKHKNKPQIQQYLEHKLGYSSLETKSKMRLPITNATQRLFSQHIRHAQQIITQQRKATTISQPTRDATLKSGGSLRMLRSATRMAIDNFYTSSQQKHEMPLQLFERMHKMFKSFGEKPEKQSKK